MFGRNYVTGMINRSSESEPDRRRFLRSAGLGGLGVASAAALSSTGLAAASAADAQAGAPSDGAVLNFALNLEYLEGQFYSYAVTGAGLPENLTTGKGDQGTVKGGSAVPFESKKARQYAEEIAADERAHVEFLRTALGSAKVAQPQIDLRDSFTAAARAAGLVQKGERFDPFENENNFLLAAYLFEDVGVTAYKGASPLVQNKTYLEAAAGLLAAEAYHAANIRTVLFDKEPGPLDSLLGGARDLKEAAGMLSDARDSLDGTSDLDQGIVDDNGRANIVPTDATGKAFSRSAGQVLNIVYLTPERATSGGFFPRGVNGELATSGDNA